MHMQGVYVDPTDGAMASMYQGKSPLVVYGNPAYPGSESARDHCHSQTTKTLYGGECPVPLARLTPYMEGIHIGEPVGRYLPQHHLDMDIKVEVDGAYGLELGAAGGVGPGPLGPGGVPSPGQGQGPGRTRKNKEDKVCGVCGDRALGYNFDAISCESCKAFFRRNAPKGLDYFKCPYDEKCKMDISNRRFCKRCRLRKCFEIGMRKEYILTEEEKARKRQKIEENRDKRDCNDPTGWDPDRIKDKPSQPHLHHQNSSCSPPARGIGGGLDDVSPQDTSPPGAVQQPNGPAPYQMAPARPMQSVPPGVFPLRPEQSPHYMPCRVTPDHMDQTSSSSSMLPPDTAGSPTTGLSYEEMELIEELKMAYRGSLEISMEKELSRDCARDMGDLVNIAEISVRRVIDMAKKVKAFKSLPQADQISLLKGGSIELLILRSVITFDKEKQHFLEGGDHEDTSAMNLEQLKKAEGGLFEDHMNFVRSLAVDLNADQTTLILLLVVSLFSPDRPNLFNKQLVWQEQERYSMLLKKYLETKYAIPVSRHIYPKLLMKLTDIRNLNEEHSQVLLKVNPESIQPLMQEVLDLRA